MGQQKTLLVDDIYLLEKFVGKGGWTFARIPEVLQNKDNPFGWVTVSGSIDDYQLEKVKLMPMGDGKLFLPVSKKVRKELEKAAGDTVHIRLSADDDILAVPSEIAECLENEPVDLRERLDNMSFGVKKRHFQRIADAKTDDIKAQRILALIQELENK